MSTHRVIIQTATILGHKHTSCWCPSNLNTRNCSRDCARTLSTRTTFLDFVFLRRRFFAERSSKHISFEETTSFQRYEETTCVSTLRGNSLCFNITEASYWIVLSLTLSFHEFEKKVFCGTFLKAYFIRRNNFFSTLRRNNLCFDITRKQLVFQHYWSFVLDCSLAHPIFPRIENFHDLILSQIHILNPDDPGTILRDDPKGRS